MSGYTDQYLWSIVWSFNRIHLAVLRSYFISYVHWPCLFTFWFPICCVTQKDILKWTSLMLWLGKGVCYDFMINCSETVQLLFKQYFLSQCNIFLLNQPVDIYMWFIYETWPIYAPPIFNLHCNLWGFTSRQTVDI